MTHDLGLINASDAIIWRSAWATGYILEGARLTACRIGTWTGPSPRTARAAVLPPALAAQPPSSPTPPSPQQLNVKSVPYFQSVRGRALVARSKRKPTALPRVPYAEYIAAVRRAHAQQRIESDEVTLSHAVSRGVEPPPTGRVRFADDARPAKAPRTISSPWRCATKERGVKAV